jgi:hypothetical protein
VSWVLPGVREVVPAIRRAAGLVADRHRPGYWRDYHQRNLKKRRAYLRKKARQYRRERRKRLKGGT